MNLPNFDSSRFIRSANYFPHIIRRFSAYIVNLPYGRMFLLSILFLSFINIYSYEFLPSAPENTLKKQIMKEPENSSLHEKLGLYYLSINRIEAYKEYLLAQEYYTSPPTDQKEVLGTKSPPLETWENLEKARKNMENEISYWKDIYEYFPQFQYAPLRIGVILFELGDYERAKDYISKVLVESPEEITAIKLSEKLKKG